MMLFLTGSMSHADAAKVQVGFHNALYHWPGFPGDTFTRKFTVKSVRNTSQQNNSVITFACELINNKGRVCMSADKTMIFPFQASAPSSVTAPHNPVTSEQPFRSHLLSKAETLNQLGSHSLKALRPNQLIIHHMTRSLTFSQSQQLASLARLTHSRHFDTRKFDQRTEIFVPGGLVLGLAMSNSARDLHEILHEEVSEVIGTGLPIPKLKVFQKKKIKIYYSMQCTRADSPSLPFFSLSAPSILYDCHLNPEFFAHSGQ